VRVTVLGSGTSSGVPTVGCDCPVCTSSNPKDKRTRAAILVEEKGTRILIDTGPDLRNQLLSAGVNKLDYVLLTHYHYDHIGGLDDLRPLSYKSKSAIPCYVDKDTLLVIRKNMPHVNASLENFYGPRLDCREYPQVDNLFQTLEFAGLEVQPIKMLHVPQVPIFSVGYVFANCFAYLTDFKKILPEYESHLMGLDTIFIGAPLPKHHPTHQSHQDAFELLERLKPKRGIIGHLAHTLSHDSMSKDWPAEIRPAYDGMVLNFSLND
jgi:phosphoribosyl 1,2-cyclic phosphate phosphodiesterase